MMSDFNFRGRLDSELKNIEFTEQSKQKVLERVKKDVAHYSDRSSQIGLKHGQTYTAWLEQVNRFLEIELRIPVKPLAVALLITMSGLVYGCIGAAGVSAEEMQKSSITVIDSNNGGQSNDLYKD